MQQEEALPPHIDFLLSKPPGLWNCGRHSGRSCDYGRRAGYGTTDPAVPARHGKVQSLSDAS